MENGYQDDELKIRVAMSRDSVLIKYLDKAICHDVTARNTTTMLQLLPTEIALHIASYLPLQSLCQVSLVCTEWHSLIADNQRTVYRNAAILHRFVHDDDLGADGRHRDWMQFCL